jgi:chromosome segregation ATPase
MQTRIRSHVTLLIKHMETNVHRLYGTGLFPWWEIIENLGWNKTGADKQEEEPHYGTHSLVIHKASVLQKNQQLENVSCVTTGIVQQEGEPNQDQLREQRSSRSLTFDMNNDSSHISRSGHDFAKLWKVLETGLRDEKTGNETELQKKTCEVAELQNRNTSLTEEVSSLKIQVQKSTCEVAEEKSRNNCLTEELDSLKIQLAQVTSASAEMKERCEILQKRIEKLSGVRGNQDKLGQQNELLKEEAKFWSTRWIQAVEVQQEAQLLQRGAEQKLEESEKARKELLSRLDAVHATNVTRITKMTTMSTEPSTSPSQRPRKRNKAVLP